MLAQGTSCEQAVRHVVEIDDEAQDVRSLCGRRFVEAYYVLDTLDGGRLSRVSCPLCYLAAHKRMSLEKVVRGAR